MGRWRPPPPKSSPYITVEGFATLQADLDEHWKRRRTVVRALAEAAAEGDRSENAEYIYRKRELAGIDRRIHYLQKRLPALNVVREAPAGDKVFFGATVKLRDQEQTVSTLRIVGPDETNAAKRAISIDSPMSKALLGKSVGDNITITTDATEMAYEIVSIRYKKAAEN